MKAASANTPQASAWTGRLISLLEIGAGVVCLILFWYPIPLRIFNVGNLLGLLLGLGLILTGLFRRRLPGKVLLALRILFLTGLAVLALEGFFILRQASRRPAAEGTVIVLGCGVRGKSPSLMLRQRIDAAAEYLKEHPTLSVICTGGLGTNATITEAACIARELMDRGIEAERIYLEDRSESTSENLAFSLSIIRAEGLDEKLIIISSDFHLYRALSMAKRLGLEAETLAAPTPAGLYPTFFVRECIALLKEWIIPDRMISQ